MKNKSTLFLVKIYTAIVALLFALNVNAQQQIYKYNNSAKEGLNIVSQSNKGLVLDYSINQFSTYANNINGEVMQNISLPGVFLPNEAGYPDLPGNGKYIAIPQGSKPIVKMISYNTETIKGIDIAPAPVIPLEQYNTPIVYEKNNAVYSKNAFYPEKIIELSEITQIRGVDVITLGITPFQYNPVSKELIVYKDIKIEISFEGGNGQFGDNAYRSRWWDPIMSDAILNYSQLPFIDYNERMLNIKDADVTGCEYAIIIPNNPEFSQWADSIKKFRTEQGILTNVYKLSDIGGSTAAEIKTWVTDAYNNWTIKPAAMLILADYGTNTASTIISNLYKHPSTSYPDYASDNYYADITGDDLPDVVFSRITANNATQLQVMCSKFLNYERNPPTDAAFYDKPITALGWQDDRWFQIGSEIVGGYFRSIGKHPVRINALGSPASNTGDDVPGEGIWSTASNTTTVMNYFGPSGLNYLPAEPGTLGGFTGGTATAVNNAINSGSFMIMHRDHGLYSGWGEPSYTTTSISSLRNVNNKLTFVFSINCETGGYHRTSECFAEKFHRYTYGGANSGALGLIAATEVSYSFVNDTYIWGMYDNMWPDFMPAYGTTPASRDIRPAFANAAGKYFLKQSSWAGSTYKQVTYRLFHMHGDAFQWIYSEVPQNLTVVHNSCIDEGATFFTVTADAGSFIAITANGQILGTATGTGAPVNITVPAQTPPANILVTITKQNYFRYSSLVCVSPDVSVSDNISSGNINLNCYPNPFNKSTTLSYSLDKPYKVTLSVYNIYGKEVAVIIDNVSKSGGSYNVQLNSEKLSSGIYSCVLRNDAQVVTRKIVITK
ncbi:MAG: C25 family cysteine peptidase [Bacteroidales bacterium]|nr:C25 family cysteine peptidase [Bacteroidales bacterium]